MIYQISGMAALYLVPHKSNLNRARCKQIRAPAPDSEVVTLKYVSTIGVKQVLFLICSYLIGVQNKPDFLILTSV